MQYVDNMKIGLAMLLELLFNAKTTRLEFLLFFFLFTSTLINAETVIGQCVGITDGDTATLLLPDNSQKEVKFWGIDAPESRQDFGQRAMQKLSDLIFKKEVKVEVSETDLYGRAIGKVYVDSTYVNLEMVIAGLAWHNVQHDSNDIELAEAEKFARTLKRGLWGGNSPIAPWEFRKIMSQKEEKDPKPTTETAPSQSLEEITILRVKDADSLVIQTADGTITTVFLYGCDAPENGQPYSKEAKEELEKLVRDKKVRLSKKNDGSNRGKRIVKLYAENVYVNERMVSAGYGHVPPSCRDALLNSSQEKAKASNYGMWIAGAAIVSPWAYRQVEEAKQAKEEARRAEAERKWRERQMNDDDYYYSPRKRSSSTGPSFSTGGDVQVKGYYRKDGTYVRPHTRKRR